MSKKGTTRPVFFKNGSFFINIPMSVVKAAGVKDKKQFKVTKKGNMIILKARNDSEFL